MGGLLDKQAVTWRFTEVGGWRLYNFHERNLSVDLPILKKCITAKEVLLIGSPTGRPMEEVLPKWGVVGFKILSDERDCRRAIISTSELPKLGRAYEICIVTTSAEPDKPALVTQRDSELVDFFWSCPERLARFLEQIQCGFYYFNDSAGFSSLLIKQPDAAEMIFGDSLLRQYRMTYKEAPFPFSRLHLRAILHQDCGYLKMHGGKIVVGPDEIRFPLAARSRYEDDEDDIVLSEGIIRGDDIEFVDRAELVPMVEKDPGLGKSFLQILLWFVGVPILYLLVRMGCAALGRSMNP